MDDGGLVVLAYFFPPMSAGSSFVIDRLLSQFDLTDTVVFAGEADRFAAHHDHPAAAQVEVRHRDVPRWWPQDDKVVEAGGRRIRIRLRALGNMLVAIRVALEAARELRSDRSRGLLVVYPKQHFLFAAAVAASFSRKPLLVYFMDVYVEGLPGGRRVAHFIERSLLRRARVVFAMSDAHREYVEARCRSAGAGRTEVVEIPHLYRETEIPAIARPAGRPSIVFTGSIYHAQADAIRRLIEALDHPALDEFEPHLHLLSPMDAGSVATFGIQTGPRVSLRAASSLEALAAQRGADILYLPIAFDLPPVQAGTASPSKMPEYLAAGCPILVHAPRDSYVARYAREQGFAEVVDEPDVAAIVAAIRRLASDDARREALIAAAGEALSRHRIENVAALFRDCVNEAVAGEGSRDPG